MLRIIEVNSEEQFKQLRNIEKSHEADYLYLLKYCNQIKMSDGGDIKNFSGVVFCETEEEFNNIENKENILYVVGKSKVYFGETPITQQCTEEDINNAINEVLNELKAKNEPVIDKEDNEEDNTEEEEE